MLLTAQTARVLVALPATLVVIYFIPSRPVATLLLLLIWFVIFRPISKSEAALFLFACTFFLFQNYVTLRAGLFEFQHKDILLMPWYEPWLWGFYFLSLRRLVEGTRPDPRPLEPKAVVAVIITSVAFSVFGEDSRQLLFATLGSTGLLLVLFHTAGDLAYAVSALVLGFIIEIFGVSTGLWWYPAPDFLGIPFWFATMWISVGLLGRRFLVPASQWMAARFGRQRA